MAGYARVTVKGNASAKLNAIKRQFRGKPQVKVGHVAGTDPFVIDKAAINEFGSDTIPERPAHRLAIDTSKPDFKNIMRRDARLMVAGRMDMATHLNRLGAEGKEAIQRMMFSLSDPSNARATLAQKDGSNPLIDSGETVEAVTWKTEK